MSEVQVSNARRVGFTALANGVRRRTSSMLDVYEDRETFLGEVHVLAVRAVWPERLNLAPFGYQVLYGSQHRDGTNDLCIVTLRSSRGRIVCVLTETSPGVRPVEFREPFASIVTGDKIASIKDLIAEIKR